MSVTKAEHKRSGLLRIGYNPRAMDLRKGNAPNLSSVGLGLALVVGCLAGPHRRYEAREEEAILRRLTSPEADWLLSGITRSLVHASRKESETDVEALEAGFRAIVAYRRGDKEPLARLGGVGAFLARLGRHVDHRDPAVRGYAIMALGLSGDRSWAPEFVRILRADARREDSKEPEGVEGDDEPIHVSMVPPAAMALGLLGAREHASELVALLGSSSRGPRGAAATGLGFMRASDRAAEVARLLDDDEVAGAAVFALARMGAREYGARIAGLMGAFPSTDTLAYAYALVRLEARDQIPAIARFLGDSYHGRTAARALALLGAREHAGAIAGLLGSEDFSLRRAGLTSLGILGERERAAAMAKLLGDSEKTVRHDAAVALILLGAREHTREVLAELADGPPDISRYDFDPIVVDQVAALNERVQRELEEWRRAYSAHPE